MKSLVFFKRKQDCKESKSLSFLDQFIQETKLLLKQSFDNNFSSFNFSEDKIVGLMSFTIFKDEISNFTSMFVSLMRSNSRAKILIETLIFKI